MKEVRHKGPYTVGFLLYEMSRTGKSGLPWWSVVKDLAYTRDTGMIPGLGGSHMLRSH